MADKSEAWQDLVNASMVLLLGYDAEFPAGSKVWISKNIRKEDEEYYRKALATVLETGNPPKEVCSALAALITPAREDAETILERAQRNTAHSNRMIRFGFRKKGDGPNQSGRDTEIVRLILSYHREGETIDAARQRVADKVGLSTDAIKKIWDRYKPFRDGGFL